MTYNSKGAKLLQSVMRESRKRTGAEPIVEVTGDFRFYNDPGHGWLEVRPEQMDAAGFVPEDFSQFSYRTDFFYLEEDCDAPKFLQRWEEMFGKPIIRDTYSNSDSFIRNLRSIHDV